MGSFSRSSFSFDRAMDLSSSLKESSRGKNRFLNSTSSHTNRTRGNETSIEKPCTVAAISEGRGVFKGTIGVAIMDVRRADIELNEFMDSAALTRLKVKLRIAEPFEVLVPESFHERSTNAILTEMIRSSLPNATVTNIHRRFFNHSRGAELVTLLANMEVSNCDSSVLKKQFCMESCAALIKYVEHIHNIAFASRTLQFVYHVSSWKNLELDSGHKGKKQEVSLLSVIDFTQTLGGARLLRSNLLQPSGDQDVIDQRLDAVEELSKNPHLLEKLRYIMGSTKDLDNFFGVLVGSPRDATVQSGDYNLTQLLRLKQVICVVDPLRNLMKNFKSALLKEKCELLCDERIDKVREVLLDKIQQDEAWSKKKNSLNIRHKKCYAIKEGISVNLDVARRAYEELLRDVKAQESELAESLPNQNVRLAFSAARGFHYVWICSNANSVSLPSGFINITRNRTSVTFSSRNLIRCNDRIDQSISEIMIATDAVVQEIIREVRPLVAILYHLMECIATTDMLCSFAVYSANTQTVRPRFGKNVIIKDGRHPLLDSTLGDGVVPNDTYLTEDSRVLIITGPNMAGKSTYLKQVCQLCLLAQSGCFVPAKVAVLPVFLRIFSRMGHNDDLSRNLSAFAVEMDEIAYMLQHSDSRSLLVIDELARSTSAEEGIGISCAIIEKLIKQKAFTIFATHFLDLAALETKYTCVENFHFPSNVAVIDGQEQFCSSRKLHRGSYTGPLYGFELVELTTFPQEVVDNARELAQRLHEEAVGKRTPDSDALARQVLLRSARRLREIVASKDVADPETLKRSLIDVQTYLRNSPAVAAMLKHREKV
ncbi:hypothetical protein Q1695_015118 [Nippostrongylus brasiliensis]|nr:hypothetical protein Q1695_015118 [Nippostrongylus brasiliensis]